MGQEKLLLQEFVAPARAAQLKLFLTVVIKSSIAAFEIYSDDFSKSWRLLSFFADPFLFYCE